MMNRTSDDGARIRAGTGTAHAPDHTLPGEAEIEISVVVPCYRSEKSLPELYERLVTALEKLVGDAFELVFVNDCSPDRVDRVIEELVSRDFRVIGVELMFNVGQFRALVCGFDIARGRYIVTMDDDLQHPPEDVPLLYEHLRNHRELDAVFGSYVKKEHPSLRNFGSFAMRKLNDLFFTKHKDLVMSSFRCLRRDLVRTITSHRTLFPIMGPVILSSTTRIANVSVRHLARKHGSSNYGFWRLIKASVDNIINFSSLPLRAIGAFGIVTALGAFFFAVYNFILYFTVGIGVPGWTTLVILVAFLGGAILFSLGVIGEYINRILIEVSGGPRYSIRTLHRATPPLEPPQCSGPPGAS